MSSGLLASCYVLKMKKWVNGCVFFEASLGGSPTVRQTWAPEMVERLFFRWRISRGRGS